MLLTSFQSVSLDLLGSGSEPQHREVYTFINDLIHKDNWRTNCRIYTNISPVSPVKSRRYRCLHSEESAVAILKCLQTEDSLTTERTSSSRTTLRKSSGGRAARPNATGRDIAGDTQRQQVHQGQQTHRDNILLVNVKLRTRVRPVCIFCPSVFTVSGGSDQRERQLVFEGPRQFLQIFKSRGCIFS